MTGTRNESLYGILATGSAFLFWGLIPPYWKLLAQIPATELLIHRITWSLPWLILCVALRRDWRQLVAAVSSHRTRLTLVASTALITVNWFTFIWAINNDHLLDASLGYYINPLVSVALGMIFLGERLSRARWVAVVLAFIGVMILTSHLGHLPWVSLAVAFSFGLYGLLRKIVAAGPVVGLTVEVGLLMPVCIIYLARAEQRGVGALGHHGLGTDLLLIVAGLVTVAPLILFTYGARRLSLATVGFLQYLAPTGQLLLATLAYHEPFSTSHLAAFGCIWIALLIYTNDLRHRVG